MFLRSLIYLPCHFFTSSLPYIILDDSSSMQDSFVNDNLLTHFSLLPSKPRLDAACKYIYVKVLVPLNINVNSMIDHEDAILCPVVGEVQSAGMV